MSPGSPGTARRAVTGPEVLRALWESVPAGMRLTCFRPDTVPNEYRGGLGEVGWLRRGLQWYCKVGLETGTMAWGTVQHRIDAAVVFDAFLAGRDVPGPWLADGPEQGRTLLLEFLGHVRGLQVQHPGRTHGQPLSQSRISALLNGVEQFYLFMHDQRETAAAGLAEPGWLRLGPQRAMFFRRGEKPRRSRNRSHEHEVIDADAFARIMAGAGLLGTPTANDGLGDEQAMRILMLLARTGRRVRPDHPNAAWASASWGHPAMPRPLGPRTGWSG